MNKTFIRRVTSAAIALMMVTMPVLYGKFVVETDLNTAEAAETSVTNIDTEANSESGGGVKSSNSETNTERSGLPDETDEPAETSVTSETEPPAETEVTTATGETSAETTAPTEDVIGDTSNTDETDMNTQEDSETDETEETENSDISLLSLEDAETLVYNGITFNAWTDTTSLPTENGNYYLTNDVTISDGVMITENEDIKICLHGKKITSTADMAYLAVFNNEANLEIYDDSGEGSINNVIVGGYYGTLTLNDVIITREHIVAVQSYEGGTVTLNGTTVNGYADVDSAGTLIVNSGTTIGGEIGTGIIVTSGTVVVNGGDITGNEYGIRYNLNSDSNNDKVIINGGNICGKTRDGILLDGGTLTVTGGKITSDVEAIYVGQTTFNLSGNAEIDGEISVVKGCPINIVGELTNSEPYVIDMNKPGVFATGGNAAEYADKFEPSQSLKDKGYSVKVNADGNLELVPHEHEGADGVFMPWTETTKLPDTAGNWYLTEDVNGEWTVPDGTTINLCLNGHTINGLITVNEGTTLNIYDEAEGKGTINGSYQYAMVNNGTVTIYDGNINDSEISGLRNEQHGELIVKGGKIERINNFNKVTISGGNIEELKLEGSVDNVKCNITGGTIKRISVLSNTSGGDCLHLSGNVEINEIHMYGSDIINIDGVLSNTVTCTIIMEYPGIFTKGASGNTSEANFVSGVENYDVAVDDSGELMLKGKPHKHADGKNFEAFAGGYLNGGFYYIAADNIDIKDISGNVDLCLNGKSLKFNLNIESDTVLNIYDDGVPGEKVQFYIDGVELDLGGRDQTINIYGGHIELSSDVYTPVTINVHGGKLVAGSVFSMDEGNLNISGGEIIGEIRHDDGTLTLSGSPKMDEATITITTENPIKITGQLGADVKCKVQLGKYGKYDETGLFAVLSDESYATADNFEAAVEGYKVVKVGDKLYIKDHVHEDGTGFEPWTDTTKLPDTAGNWYLTGNVTVTDYNGWKVPAGVTNLCLNGNTIDLGNLIYISSGAALNIYDEPGNKGIITNSINMSGGSLSINGGTLKAEYGTNIEIVSNSNISITGGVLEGEIYCTAYAAFEENVITISGGTVNGIEFYDAANTTLNISGNAVINKQSGYDYAIYSSCKLNISGGTIDGISFFGQGFDLSGSPVINGKIHLADGKVITITDKLTNEQPYVIDMNKPGVFAAGAYAAQSKDKFKPSDKLASEGYEVIVTEGNELAIGIGYPHKVKPGETFETDNGTITNKDGTVEMEDKDGNKTTVTLPDTSDSVEVDENGNVTVPAGSKVQSGDTEVTLPDGGTIDKDGTITADEIQIGDVTVTGDDVTVDKDGNIKVPNGGTVQTGGTEVTLPKGGTIDKDGKVTVPNDSIISVTKSNVTVEYADNAKFTDGKNNYSVSESNGFILLDIDDKSSEKININGFEVKAAYDITLLYNGKTKVQPSGKVKVTLDVPTDVDIEKARVFHENSYDGFDEITVTERASRTLSFEAEHFSIYVIATAVAPSVPDSPGSSGDTDPTDEPVDDNDNNNNSNNNNNNSSNNNNNGSSGGTPTAPKEQTKLINISVDNKINGKTSVVISRMSNNVITAELGKEFNGLFANVFTEGGDLIYASEIKDGTIKFTYTKDEKLVIVIDSISYAEDLTAGAGEFSSESEIVENSGVKSAVHISIIFAAAIMTGIVLKKKKQ